MRGWPESWGSDGERRSKRMRPYLFRVDACRYRRKHKDQQEIKPEQREFRSLLGFREVEEEARVWDDAKGKQLLRDGLGERLLVERDAPGLV